MRSFRAKPIGWQHDSYRHSLAAKGVRTRYNAFKEGTGLLDTTEVNGLDTEMRERTVQEATVIAENRLKEEEDERKMPSEWTERYMRDEFPGFANRYLSDQVYTRQQFLDELKRDVDRYAGRNSGELKVFDWGNGN